ncbi:MAG: MarR family transcriptional regulator [Bryobacteraceae bacterium]
MQQHEEQLLKIPCACATLRRATRVVTQLYEDAFRPMGLTAPQFTVMAVLDAFGEMTHSRLGELLATDATTLTRTLQLMTRRGWLQTAKGQDKRQRLISLSEEGKAAFERTKPVWQEVQGRLRAAYGTTDWGQMLTLVDRVTEGAQQVLEGQGTQTT